MKHTFFPSVALLVCVIGAGVAFADEPMRHGGWGGISLGARTANVTSLNDYLGALDMDPLPAAWPMIGWQAHGLIFEHIVFGLSGNIAAFSRESDGSVSMSSGPNERGQATEVRSDDLQLAVLATSAQLDVGYAVLNGSSGLGYPYLAVGGGATNLVFAGDVWRVGLGESPSELSPDELAALDDEGTLRQGTMYAQVGFTYYWPVRFARSPYGAFGMFLPGVTGGVNWGLSENGWRDGEKLYRHGPDLTPTGVFLQVELAFGGGVEVRATREIE